MLHLLLLKFMVITTCEMVFTSGEHSDHTFTTKVATWKTIWRFPFMLLSPKIIQAKCTVNFKYFPEALSHLPFKQLSNQGFL